jgi:hypothetical protein
MLRPRARELDVVLVLPDRRVSRETAVKLITMKGRQAALKAAEDKLYEVVSAAFGVRSSETRTQTAKWRREVTLPHPLRISDHVLQPV